MSDSGPSRMIYRGGVEADARVSRAQDAPFWGWIRTALVFVVVGIALVVLNAPIAQPWGLIAAATFIVFGIAAGVFGFVVRPRPDPRSREVSPAARRTVAIAIWVGAAAALVIALIGLLWGPTS